MLALSLDGSLLEQLDDTTQPHAVSLPSLSTTTTASSTATAASLSSLRSSINNSLQSPTTTASTSSMSSLPNVSAMIAGSAPNVSPLHAMMLSRESSTTTTASLVNKFFLHSYETWLSSNCQSRRRIRISLHRCHAFLLRRAVLLHHRHLHRHRHLRHLIMRK